MFQRYCILINVLDAEFDYRTFHGPVTDNFFINVKFLHLAVFLRK